MDIWIAVVIIVALVLSLALIFAGAYKHGKSVARKAAKDTIDHAQRTMLGFKEEAETALDNQLLLVQCIDEWISYFDSTGDRRKAGACPVCCNQGKHSKKCPMVITEDVMEKISPQKKPA